MKLGYFTACFTDSSLEALCEHAHSAGFDALEVAAWPGTTRDRTACHLDVTRLPERDADRVRGLFAAHDLTLSAISYYENNLHPDTRRRAEIHAHLRACVEAAARLGVRHVGTFVGRDPGLTVAANLALAERVLPPLVDFAAGHGVALVVENCPMEGWHPDGYPGNLAYSPELWEWMFGLGLHLNYDPSHLLWLGIDPVGALEWLAAGGFADRVGHVQAKDTRVLPAGRDRHGVFGRAIRGADPWRSGWWEYRMPGLGDVDWRGVVDALYRIGFDGVIAIEHEDPHWSGDDARVRHGLEYARRTLRPLLVA
ncbi:sugar phosphate isomerase/epimerase [Actinosynnema sp. NPDC020468]|uniref:sugar phosphate isomerase/epimerase family protein n=1 Tax=Actinosynnema sp. NPDC020468 TaxID=3154488 RepID=UPI0033E4E498